MLFNYSCEKTQKEWRLIIMTCIIKHLEYIDGQGSALQDIKTPQICVIQEISMIFCLNLWESTKVPLHRFKFWRNKIFSLSKFLQIIYNFVVVFASRQHNWCLTIYVKAVDLHRVLWNRNQSNKILKIKHQTRLSYQVNLTRRCS